jgi:hypothetical protein
MKEEEISPELERELVIESMPRRYRRKATRQKRQKNDWPFPDFMKGLSNHQRMQLKKIGRGGEETRSRAHRNR